MKKSDQIQLIISSLIIILGIVFMISKGNIDLMFFLWLPHIWWVVMVTKLLTNKFPDKKKFTWASLTVFIGIVIYFTSLWLVITWILKMFGVNIVF